MTVVRLAAAALLVWALAQTAPARAQDPASLLTRAVSEFQTGAFTASAATFDALVKASPADAPYLWQRGIALYYAKRYGDCRAQFESHRTVNPDDVENAAWHFLCVAGAESLAAARAALLPVGPDPRSPMREIYELFRGRLTPQQVIAAAGDRPEAQFYAHLYVGLHAEASGQPELARTHIAAAADERFQARGGYMHMVARVHLRALPVR